MEWLNYHHLLYFWVVAKEGGVSRAGAVLGLSHPTISGQIHALEASLGEKLFSKVGRRLVMTEMGRVVFNYADEIFTIGRELMDTVKGRPTGRPARLVVGIADVLPKLVARRLLEPARHMKEPVHIVCREDRPDRLFADLGMHALDVVLSDSPIGPDVPVRAYNHLLGESGISWFATAELADRYRRGFPDSLDGAPVLLPTENTTLRRSLDQWFEARNLRPVIVGEFEDSALLASFGQDGDGVFPCPSAVERQVRRQHKVKLVGRAAGVKERFYAISVERRLKHPAVLAITEAARKRLFRSAAEAPGRMRHDAAAGDV
jgi:LysR family transcriptional regulator, transcriptional activator of nhaA